MPDSESRATESLRLLAARLGHEFADYGLLERALTHSSKAYEDQMDREAAVPDRESSATDRGNEQMEFLGDAVLGMVVAEWLYRNHRGDDEGRLTRLRAALVSRRNLCRVAKRLDLGAHLLLGKGEERSGGRNKAALLADAMEAVIAAVYLDGGVPAAAGLVEREVIHGSAGGPSSNHAEQAAGSLTEIEDWKSAVQEWLQARGEGRASYALVEALGPDHAKRFTVELRVHGETLAQSTASSKKQAEQQCARAALETLRQREAR